MTTNFRLKPDAMARLACAVAVAFLVFAGSCTLVGELESSRSSPPARIPEQPKPVVTPAPPPAVKNLAVEKWQAPTNLFASTHVANHLARGAAKKAAAEETARKAAEKAAARKAAEEQAAHKVAWAFSKSGAGAMPPPKPAFVAFTYRGMMRRPDATEWALIAAAPGGGTNFYRAGDLCRGLMVTNIRYREVGLIVSNGVPETLKIGQPFNLPEELCHARP